MSTHRVAIATTTGFVHSAPCTQVDANLLSVDIEKAVTNGRVVGVWTEDGYGHFNILHVVSWGVEEIQPSERH